MTARTYDRPIGELSRRIHGGRRALAEWASSAKSASLAASDEREAAALRGKAVAYSEAGRLLQAIEEGRSLPKHRTTFSAHPHAAPCTTCTRPRKVRNQAGVCLWCRPSTSQGVRA